MTPEDALYLSDACEYFSEDFSGDFSESPSEPLNSEEVGYVGLDRDSACGWSIYGLTVQGWLNLQQDLILIQNYVETIKSQRDFYETQLLNQYEAVTNVDK